MTYDDATWHHGDNWPQDLPRDASATHSGMFLAWALLAGLGGDHHRVDSPDEFAQLQARTLTPGAYFLMACDGRFTDDDLNAEGNAFTQAYFQQAGATSSRTTASTSPRACLPSTTSPTAGRASTSSRPCSTGGSRTGAGAGRPRRPRQTHTGSRSRPAWGRMARAWTFGSSP